MEQAGLHCVLDPKVEVVIWEKRAFNAALSLLAAVAGLTFGEIGDRPEERACVKLFRSGSSLLSPTFSAATKARQRVGLFEKRQTGFIICGASSLRSPMPVKTQGYLPASRSSFVRLGWRARVLWRWLTLWTSTASTGGVLRTEHRCRQIRTAADPCHLFEYARRGPAICVTNFLTSSSRLVAREPRRRPPDPSQNAPIAAFPLVVTPSGSVHRRRTVFALRQCHVAAVDELDDGIVADDHSVAVIAAEGERTGAASETWRPSSLSPSKMNGRSARTSRY